jgi:hypothetical protein
MRVVLAAVSAAALVVALPSATHAANGVVASCTTPAGTGTCSTGWYTTDVQVDFTINGGTDPSSGCSGGTVNSDTTGETFVCTVDIGGGQIVGQSVTIMRDATPPIVASVTAARAPDSNGWYNQPVQVTATGSDATSGIASCTSVTYAGPDSSAASVTATCIDNAGNRSTPQTLSLQYDATPPSITAAPARPPDANGWYNHPVTVAFTGTDATSGVASCDTVSYDGPDSADATVTGTCRDQAGNVAATSSLSLRYDATPPTLSDLVAANTKRGTKLSWKVSADAVRIMIVRLGGGKKRTVYDGKRIARITGGGLRAGLRYVFIITAVDEAGNAATLKRSVTAKSSLLAPPPGARIHGHTVLRWRSVAHATYYNVQLWYRGQKILTTWPSRSRLVTPPGLRPGRYTWIVWPGLGPRSAGRYGPKIGRSSFVIVP